MTATASAPSTTTGERPRRGRWQRALRHPLAHLVLALTVIAVVQGFAFKVYAVPSESMSPTLEVGDRILADRISTATGLPKAGDIVVFERPDAWRDGPAPERPWWRTAAGRAGDLVGFGPSNGDALVKRVIAGPGQTMRCCDDDGRLSVDGAPLDEAYVANDLPFEPGVLDCTTTPRSMRCVDEIVLGDDEYLVLGDNRAASLDSLTPCRTAGGPAPADCARTITRNDVVGAVTLRFWPLDDVGTTR